MKTKLVTIGDDASVYDAARKIKEENVGSVIVLNARTRKPYGILTQGDIVRKCVARRQMNGSVKRIASKPLIGVAPEADLSDAAKLMRDERVKKLVVFKDGRIVGIISSSDIVSVSPSLYDLVSERQYARR